MVDASTNKFISVLTPVAFLLKNATMTGSDEKRAVGMKAMLQTNTVMEDAGGLHKQSSILMLS